MKLIETAVGRIESINYGTRRSLRSLFSSKPVTRVVVSVGDSQYEASKWGHGIQAKEGQELLVQITKDSGLTAQLKRLVGKDPDVLKLYPNSTI